MEWFKKGRTGKPASANFNPIYDAYSPLVKQLLSERCQLMLSIVRIEQTNDPTKREKLLERLIQGNRKIIEYHDG